MTNLYGISGKERVECAMDAWLAKDEQWRSALAEFAGDKDFKLLDRMYHNQKNQVQKYIGGLYMADKNYKKEKI